MSNGEIALLVIGVITTLSTVIVEIIAYCISIKNIKKDGVKHNENYKG